MASSGGSWKNGTFRTQAQETRRQYSPERQRLTNSLREGELRLQSQRDALGKRLSAASLDSVRRSVENTRAKIEAFDREFN